MNQNRFPSRQTIPAHLQPSQSADSKGRPKYNWAVKNIYAASAIVRDPGTFAIGFVNLGDSIATVNGKVLFPGTVGAIQGDAFTIGINMEDFEFSGIVNVAFSGGSGVLNNLEVTTLFYNEN